MDKNASAETSPSKTETLVCAKCGKTKPGAPAKFYYGGEFQEDDQSELGKIMNRKRTFYKVIASDEIPICNSCVKTYKYVRLVPLVITAIFCFAAFIKTSIMFVNSFASEMDPLPLPFMAFFLYGATIMIYKTVNLKEESVLRDKIAIDLKKPSIGRKFRYFTQAEHARFKIRKK